MPRHKILIIANRRSGTGSTVDLKTLATRIFRELHAEYTLEYTRAPGHATELAYDGMRNGCTAIVAAGGDGTVNEVARAVVGSDTPMGIIPRGSGNGLARHLGIPLDPERALASIVQATPIPIDTFTLNERLSLNVSGIGFDGHVAAVFNESKRRGLFNYARIAITEYRKFVPFHATVQAESTPPELRDIFFVAIANSSQYGNNARIAPDASVRDGKLTINAVTRIPLHRLDAVWSLFRGDVTRKSWCTTFEVINIILHTDRKVAYHVDGEPCGVDDTFVVRVRPASLRMIIPDEGV